jgi:hypothetical protein
MRLDPGIAALELDAKASSDALAVAEAADDPFTRLSARMMQPEAQRLLRATIWLINQHGDRVLEVIRANAKERLRLEERRVNGHD